MNPSPMPRADHHLPGDLDAPARSRRLTERTVGDHPRRGELVLAVSELVANAVLHGSGTRERGLTLSFDQDEDRLRIGVEHEGEPFDPTVDRPFHGLGMVDQIVDRWGIDSHGSRVLVWFEVDHGPNAGTIVGGSRGNQHR
jgi:hypothetical protein